MNCRAHSIRASGMIVSANQNPFPADYKYSVGGEFAPHYRSQQIRSLLSKAKARKPEDMLVIQKDVYSASSHFIAQQVVAAYDKRGAKNPSLQTGAEVLRKWNGQMDKDESAPSDHNAYISATPASDREIVHRMAKAICGKP